MEEDVSSESSEEIQSKPMAKPAKFKGGYREHKVPNKRKISFSSSSDSGNSDGNGHSSSQSRKKSKSEKPNIRLCNKLSSQLTFYDSKTDGQIDEWLGRMEFIAGPYSLSDVEMEY